MAAAAEAARGGRGMAKVHFGETSSVRARFGRVSSESGGRCRRERFSVFSAASKLQNSDIGLPFRMFEFEF